MPPYFGITVESLPTGLDRRGKQRPNAVATLCNIQINHHQHLVLESQRGEYLSTIFVPGALQMRTIRWCRLGVVHPQNQRPVSRCTCIFTSIPFPEESLAL